MVEFIAATVRRREVGARARAVGTLTGGFASIVAKVRKRFDGIIGIHTHNDADKAVANTIAGIEAGCTHVRACMNGYGERCGNSNLVSIIANLEWKLGHSTIREDKPRSLAARALHRRAQGQRPRQRRAQWTPRPASTSIRRAPATNQGVPLGGLSGRGNILYKLKEEGSPAARRSARRELLERIKTIEYMG